jgi:hypothetical protein
VSRVASRCSGRGIDRSTRRGSRALSVGPSVPARQSPVRLSPGISIRRYPELINDDEKLLENSFVVPDAALADVSAAVRAPTANGSVPRPAFANP